MPYFYNRIIDANLNRISEGLRVIEEYTRFIANNPELTYQLALIRKKINLSETEPIQNLQIRDSRFDVRAKEKPSKRQGLTALLKANFKRVEEGLRVLEEYTGNSLYNKLRYDIYELEKKIVLTLLKKPIKNGIYLISDKVEVLKKGLKWGVALIQLRDKKSSKKEILAKAKEIKKYAQKFETPFIINDYLDIALLVDADGLHTGQDDLALSELRELFGPHKILGRTTHNLKQGLEAQQDGADYISVGPIWATPSKPGREAIGFEYLSQVHTQGHASLRIPYVAIGGINLKNIQEIKKYHPPLIGIIRSYQDIPKLLNLK